MHAPLQNNVITGINPLQRQLADSIVKMVPLDDIRILLATGAKVKMMIIVLKLFCGRPTIQTVILVCFC